MLQTVIVMLAIWWVASFIGPIYIRFPFKLWMKRYYAMTVAPFIFVNSRYRYIPNWVYDHERRHIVQQRILSPFIMAVLYFLFSAVIFVVDLVASRNFWHALGKAYWQNPFEIDARCNGGWYNKARCKDVFR